MKKKKNNIIKTITLILILIITIGYAALRTGLNINGIATIPRVAWDIHFENYQKLNTTNIDPTIEPDIPIGSKLTEISYAVTLSEPGDVYEFTVDVVNAGTVDGMVESIVTTLSTNGGDSITILDDKSNLPNYLDYSITYSDDTEILPNQELKAGEQETYKVHLEFKKDIDESDLVQASNKTFEFETKATYIQANENAVDRHAIDSIVYMNYRYLLRKSGKLAEYSKQNLSYNEYIEATPENLNEYVIATDVKYIDNESYLTADGKLYNLDTNDFITDDVVSLVVSGYNDVIGYYTSNKGFYSPTMDDITIPSNVDKIVSEYDDMLLGYNGVMTLENNELWFRSANLSFKFEDVSQKNGNLCRMENGDIVYLGNSIHSPNRLSGGGKVIQSSDIWIISPEGKLYNENFSELNYSGNSVFPTGIYPTEEDNVGNHFGDVIISANGHEVYSCGSSANDVGYASKEWESNEDRAVKVVKKDNSIYFVTDSNQLWKIQWPVTTKESDNYSEIADQYVELNNIINNEEAFFEDFSYADALNYVNNNSLATDMPIYDMRNSITNIVDKRISLYSDDNKQYIKLVQQIPVN